MTSRKHNIINDTLFFIFVGEKESKAILIVPFQVFLNGIKAALAWYTFPVAVSFTP
jgi:hypothetical protein